MPIRMEELMSFRLSLLAIAMIGFAACSGTSSSPSSPSPSPTATISIVAGARTLTTTAYSPSPMTVSAGTTVTWMNNDTSTHNSTADSGAFATGSIAPGASASVKLQNAGTFVYHCTIHPGMVGTIVVQ
jgi:plastocyanin